MDREENLGRCHKHGAFRRREQVHLFLNCYEDSVSGRVSRATSETLPPAGGTRSYRRNDGQVWIRESKGPSSNSKAAWRTVSRVGRGHTGSRAG